jgi:hypothetical protein
MAMRSKKPLCAVVFAILLTDLNIAVSMALVHDSSSYRSNLDVVNERFIAGWVWNRQEPARSVEISIYDGDKLLATIPADLKRDDLQKQGIGNGHNGFRFPAPASLRDGQKHTICVRVAATQEGLNGSPKSFTFVDSRNTSVPSPRTNAKSALSPHYHGYLDLVNNQFLAGWVWDPSRPNRAVSIDVYDDKKLLLTVPADRMRKDLARKGAGNGLHGFSVPLPASLKDGKRHTIRICVSGTQEELKGSPQSSAQSERVATGRSKTDPKKGS